MDRQIPRKTTLIVSVALLCVTVSMSQAAVIHVPADQPTIQAGIDAAVAGDEVVIADGTYTGDGNKNLDFGGKAITVRSASGNPEFCIIDCMGSGRGFCFHSSEGSDSVVDGLTITNGNVDDDNPRGYYGGGIYCNGASPTLLNCILRNNRAYGFGGGLYCRNCTNPILTNCVIRENITQWNDGGGIYCDSSNPVLSNCVIHHNVATKGYGRGGGMYNDDSMPLLMNCILHHNQGGAMYNDDSDGTLLNCVFTQNTALGVNIAGGLESSSSAVTLHNCILWGDSPDEVDTRSNPKPSFTYSLVQGETGQTWFGEGCIDTDPQFLFDGDYHLSAGSPCIDAGTNAPSASLPATDFDGCLRIADGNGDATATVDMGIFEYDPTTPRIAITQQGVVFEVSAGGSQQQEWVVGNAGGAILNWTISDDASWLTAESSIGQVVPGSQSSVMLTADSTGLARGRYTAELVLSDSLAQNSPIGISVILNVRVPLHVPGDYSTIQDAIDAALAGDEIVLDDGTYTGDGNKNLDFSGKAITVRSASGNPEQCIIDCEGSGRGFYFHTGESANAAIKGLTIANGYVDDDHLLNCEFSRAGAGVFCLGADPTFVNCIFINNHTLISHGDDDWACGGGVFCYLSNITLIGCRFIENSAIDTGGGMNAFGSYLTIINCVFAGNEAREGGGMYSWDSSCKLTNCVFDGNASRFHGGAYFNMESSATLVNCVFSNNTGDDEMVIGNYYCILDLNNCILWGDSPQKVSSGGSEWSDIMATASILQGGTGESWFGTGCLDTDPLFVDADGPDDDPATWADNDFRLRAGSPCIDAGRNSIVPADEFDLDGDGDVAEPLPFDLDGISRFLDDPDTPDTGEGTAPIVDMGAYEYQSDCGDGECDDGEDSCNCSLDCGEPPFELCYDGISNDCDILADSADPDCNCGDGTCTPGEDACHCPADCGTPPESETNCSDGLDNDCDGYTDYYDSDCGTMPGDVDNDGDVDLEDFQSFQMCWNRSASACLEYFDLDDDGDLDLDDFSMFESNFTGPR